MICWNASIDNPFIVISIELLKKNRRLVHDLSVARVGAATIRTEKCIRPTRKAHVQRLRIAFALVTALALAPLAAKDIEVRSLAVAHFTHCLVLLFLDEPQVRFPLLPQSQPLLGLARRTCDGLQADPVAPLRGQALTANLVYTETEIRQVLLRGRLMLTQDGIPWAHQAFHFLVLRIPDKARLLGKGRPHQVVARRWIVLGEVRQHPFDRTMKCLHARFW
mmetsp:Transcript_984/g.2521  ORF Transcript_984/g.2521 Transcript_984/m.2521 type:complete len:221 (+) Transcript_984:662-1324(+)